MTISTILNPHPIPEGMGPGKKKYVHMLNVDETKAADKKAEQEARRKAKKKRAKK